MLGLLWAFPFFFWYHNCIPSHTLFNCRLLISCIWSFKIILGSDLHISWFSFVFTSPAARDPDNFWSQLLTCGCKRSPGKSPWSCWNYPFKIFIAFHDIEYLNFVLVARSQFLAFPQPHCIIKELHAFLNKMILLSRVFHFFFQGLAKDQLLLYMQAHKCRM